MLDIGWSEMAVVAVIALLIIGPKELPSAMRSVAYWVRKVRGVTREFQSGFNEMVREAELEETRKALEDARKGDLAKTVTDTIDPTGSVTAAAKDLQSAAKDPTPSAGTSGSTASTSETSAGAKVDGVNGSQPPTEKAASGSASSFRARDALSSTPPSTASEESASQSADASPPEPSPADEVKETEPPAKSSHAG